MKTLVKYALILFAAFLLQTSGSAQQSQKVRLQLKWKHQFQFAGYYAAIEKGFYRQAGIEVELIEAPEGPNPSDAVFDGRAAFGVCTSDILLMRSEGKNAVVLATIFQHSPQILIASKASGINHVHDLVGKRIALEHNAADIIAFMNDEGISLDMCTIDQHSFDANGLLNGEIDAISAYSTDELFVVQQANFEYTIISPLMGGIDFYGDVLFTTEQFISENPALVERFREASLKGWAYAMNNPEEMIELIYTKYSTRHSIDHLRFEANHMKKLVMTEVVEPGYTNPGRWESIADTYKKLKMLPYTFSIQGLLYADYLKPEFIFPWRMIFIFVLIIIIIGSIAYFFYLTTRKLKNENIRRQLLEKEILESEKKHRVLFLDSPDAYLIIIDGIFVDCNRATEKLLRAERSQIIGKSPDFLSPEFQPDGKKSAEAAKAKIKYALRHGQNSFEWVHRRFDGTEFIVEVSIAAMTLDGKSALFTTWRDITKRKMAEEALKHSEEKFRLLLNSAAEAIYGIDVNGRSILCNPAALKILGYASEDEVLGKNFHHLIHHSHQDGSPYPLKDCKIFKAFNEGLETHMDNEVFWRKDGSSFPVEYWSYPIFRAGEIIGSVVTFFDITDRRLSENALRESEEKYRTLVETMSDGVYRSTHDGKFIEVNPAMVRILGYDSKEELMSINIKTQLYFAEEERESADLEEKLEEMAIFRLRKKDGSEIWVEDHGKHVLDENGNILYHEGSLRDVTERKYAEDEIRSKNKEFQKLNAEKDKFFSIIAHDLKSPFNSIMGFSQLLVEQMNEKDYAGIEKYAEIIHQSSGRAMDLLMNLMEWSRSQTGRIEFNPEYFEMVSLINKITPLFDDIAGQKSITIKRDLPPNNSVFADKAMVSTILRNLISNAIKFSYPGGEIVISVEESQTGLTASVSDKGVGIPKNRIDKLFRIDESYSTKGTQNEKGTGLGLILCKEFIEKHGGKIWVNSVIGKGSSFYFSIPFHYTK